MPFEFTGKIPPPLATASPFSSFATSSTPWSTAGSPSAIGALIPAGGTTTSLLATPIGDGLPQLQNKRPDGLLETEKTALNAASTNDVLMQAMRRGVMGRPAVFGHAEVAADGILSGFLASRGSGGDELQTQLASLSRAVRGLGSSSEVKVLLDYLLSELVQLKVPAQPAVLRPEPATAAAETAVAVTETLDAGEEADGDVVWPSTYHFARGSPAYCAILQHAQSSPTVRSLLADGVHVLHFCEKIVAMLGDDKKVDQLKDEIERHLRSPGDGIAVAKWLFEFADEKVLEQKLGTEAPDQAQNPLAADPDESNKAFRFLDLPPELRMWVYRQLLAPTGHISLRSPGDHFGTLGVTPRGVVTPGMLRTCKLVYEEAREILYEENTVCLNVHVDFSCWAMIQKRQMPDHVLPRLRSVMLVLDFVGPNDVVVENVEKCDWRQLQALTGLRGARICLIERGDLRDRVDVKTALLAEVVERLPLGCEIGYGAREGAEREHVEDLLVQFGKTSRRTHYGLTAWVVEGEVLEQCAAKVVGGQGGKSGHTRDYRWPEKQQVRLGALVREEDMDERLVLGR